MRLLRLAIKPVVLLPLLALFAAAMYAFQPWKLWVDDVVSEALPTVAPTPSPAAAPSVTPSAVSTAPATVFPVTLATGTFISHEHTTTGTLRVLALADGSRVLRIEDLDTSNGPDLHVWITDAPVIEGSKGWRVFDDGKYIELGNLKGNKGSQNYALPASVDLRELSSVSIWCDRFNVSFGAAELKPV